MSRRRLLGKEGRRAFAEGYYQDAYYFFYDDYLRYPDNALAQFNRVDSYRHQNRPEFAIPLYRKVARSGKNVSAYYLHLLEPHGYYTTLSEVACAYLFEYRLREPNCY